MLVLSRKVGERIVIDGGIEVEVLAVSGNRVRLGIAAPRECQIRRAELLPATGAAVLSPQVVAPPPDAGLPPLRKSPQCLV
jgi:carbon storage regulator CsrA